MKGDIGNQGLSKLAIKGSIYSFISLLILKFGGLIFTIIIARLLLPEMFGIYSLALSIVTIALMFTDLGVENTFIRYVSDFLGKNNNNRARSHARYLLKLRSSLIFIVTVSLLVTSKLLSYNLYKQPLLYYPLLFSCLFVISESFRSFFTLFFTIKKDAKTPAVFDILSQVSKIAFSVFALVIFTGPFRLPGLFLAFFFSSFVTLSLTAFVLIKRDKELLFGRTEKIDKKPVNKYLRYMALASISLAFFGSIDTLMLGKFVASEYLGYYRAALSLILSVASLFSLSSIFLPIFTQIHEKRFVRGFQKTIRYLFIISIPSVVGIIYLAKYLIFLLYGVNYLPAVTLVYFLSLLIITTPLIGLYSAILESKEKSKRVGEAVFVSLIINIILNYLSIKLFIQKPLFIIAGVGFSTFLSRFILLIILVFSARKNLNLKARGLGVRKPILATLVMGVFLYFFTKSVNMNIFFGILEIIVGAGIYFLVLILLKGLGKEDLIVLKSAIKK